MNVYKFTPLSHGDYVLPPWAQMLGWLLAINGVIMIPVVMVYHVVRSYKNPDYEGMSLRQVGTSVNRWEQWFVVGQLWVLPRVKI